MYRRLPSCRQPACGCTGLLCGGKKQTAGYRKFALTQSKPGDDYGALREVLLRRLKKVDLSHFPDLILLDGGKGHLQVALGVLKELDLTTIDLVAIAKENHKHTRGLTEEVLYQSDLEKPLHLHPKEEALFLLQRIRDEAHRFALSFQKQRRKKHLIKTQLDEIPSIGPKKRKLLLEHFGSVKRLKEASLEEIQQIKGLTKTNIAYLLDFIKGGSLPS